MLKLIIILLIELKDEKGMVINSGSDDSIAAYIDICHIFEYSIQKITYIQVGEKSGGYSPSFYATKRYR